MGCAPTTQLNDTEFLLSEFANELLQQVMLAAGTTKIAARRSFNGKYEIRIGKDLVFDGPDERQAFKKLMHWLLTKGQTLDLEAIQKEITPALAHEEERVHKLIENLTKDGMSELGIKLQEYRNTRGASIYMALKRTMELDEYRLASKKYTFNELLDEIRKFEGLEDVAPEEVLVAVNDYVLMLKETGN